MNLNKKKAPIKIQDSELPPSTKNKLEKDFKYPQITKIYHKGQKANKKIIIICLINYFQH